jgi:malonate transporter and related proteins
VIEPLLNAIAPLVLMMALGNGLRRTLVRESGVWSGIESIVYYVLMPALLFSTIARADLADLPWADLLTTLYGTILIMATLALAPLLWGSTHLPAATRSSLFQGVTRFNLYVSLALGVSLFDAQGLALLGLLSGAIVVFVNVLCVSVMVSLSSGSLNLQRMLTEVARNPLLLACLAGGSASAIDLTLPAFGWQTLERLGQTALPLSLLAIGAGLSIQKFNRNLGLNLYAGAGQLLLKPAIAWALVMATGLDLAYGAVVVLLLATPTAPSSYILARKLGGDAHAMASIVVFQSVVGFASLLLVLSLWQIVNGVRFT